MCSIAMSSLVSDAYIFPLLLVKNLEANNFVSLLPKIEPSDLLDIEMK
jgi:hypothetical protein